jgi:hypothetical protein
MEVNKDCRYNDILNKVEELYKVLQENSIATDEDMTTSGRLNLKECSGCHCEYNDFQKSIVYSTNNILEDISERLFYAREQLKFLTGKSP